MYVCVCHALTDRDIETARSGGARHAGDIYRLCGIEDQCGRCRDTIDRILAKGKAAVEP